MEWKLEVGQVRTSDEQVLVAHDDPNFFALEVDLDTKYAEVFFHSRCGDTLDFFVGVGERTLDYDRDAQGPTVLTVKPVGDSWVVIQEVTRYTWRVVGYKQKGAE